MKKLILGYYKLLKLKAEKSEIESFLVQQGIPRDEVDLFCEKYDIGFKSGVNDVITNGASSVNIQFGQDAIFDSAFYMGRHIFKSESNFFYKYRLVIVGIVIGAILLRFMI